MTFLSLLWFNIKNRLSRLSTISYFIVIFSCSFLFAISFGGAFGSINLGLSTKLALNSPATINQIVCSIGYLGILIAAPIFGQSINQDFETGFHQILFSTPIRRFTYFFLRYLSSFISVFCIFISISFGIWFATFMPFIDRSLVSENHLWFYVAPYLSNIIPNILIFGAIFIAIVSNFKKMAPVYITSIAIFTGWMIAGKLVTDLDNKLIASLIDPFGMEGANQVIRYWSVAEQSSKVTPLTGYFLYNRLLWGTIGLAFLALAYYRFNPFKLLKERKKSVKEELPLSCIKFLKINLFPRSWKVCWQLLLSEFKQVLCNNYFLSILLFTVLYVFVISSQIGKIYGTETLPVTGKVLEIIGGSFSLFIVIITTYCTGELIWKDKDRNFCEIIDSKPVSNLFLYLSRLFSLFLVQVFLSIIVIVCCVIIQIFNGYYNFEWNVYAKHLFIYTLPSWFLLSVVALFIHTLSKSKAVGHFIIIAYFILLSLLPSFGFNHKLYLIEILPKTVYSDMNGFGNFLWPFTIFSFYWGFFHLFLAVLTILFWRRGAFLTWKDRVSELRFRMKPIYKWLVHSSLCCWMLLGGYIYYNTNILNVYKTQADQQRESVDYEIIYKHFESSTQPDLVSVNVQVDIFPKNQSMNGQGIFKYKNIAKDPIKTVLINISQKSDVAYLTWNKPAILSHVDKRLGIRIYEFEEPIQAGEEIQLKFSLSTKSKGFENLESSKKIVGNGTFFYGSDFFPIIGYAPTKEIPDDKTRRKYHLPEKPRIPSLNDPNAINKTYTSQEGTWIDFEATVSTALDQIAIAPGYLEKEWTEDERRYFHYKMDRPILPFYAFLSGRYEVVRDKWQNVNIEIYHHPGHTFNISRMMHSIKKSLDYYTKNFSPYQFRQIRIVEFPRYQSFAQSFPNMIPYSENIGFIAKVKPNDPKDIDYPFYITAHEVAHQWWAHQVIGGNVQGCTMLSESLAQYSALMVMEREFGPQQMKKFLKYELDRYLNGRSLETKKELPLMLNENQGYIHYMKGSLVFYALKDYLGEEIVNKVLHDYIHDFAFQKPPFTKATDLVQRFKDITPNDKKYLIEDMFETITFYDNRTDKVSFKKISNNKYQVEIHSTNKKLRANGLGKEQEIPMDDYIDVGIFDLNENLKYLQKHKIKNGRNVFFIEVNYEPSKGGIDPLNKLIDKVSDNKVLKAREIR